MKKRGVVPGLGVILVGEDPASKSYVTAKEKACEEIGMYSSDNRLPASTGQTELLVLIEKLNHDPKIHGILVQLPLSSLPTSHPPLQPPAILPRSVVQSATGTSSQSHFGGTTRPEQPSCP